jgi:predicted transcriptional regulator
MLPLGAKRRPPRLTPKQQKILKALLKRNTDGSYLDVKQLIRKCAPGTTRGAMMCSLRHLYAHGLIEEGPLVPRRERVVRTYTITQEGINLIRPNPITP